MAPSLRTLQLLALPSKCLLSQPKPAILKPSCLIGHQSPKPEPHPGKAPGNDALQDQLEKLTARRRWAGKQGWSSGTWGFRVQGLRGLGFSGLGSRVKGYEPPNPYFIEIAEKENFNLNDLNPSPPFLLTEVGLLKRGCKRTWRVAWPI